MKKLTLLLVAILFCIPSMLWATKLKVQIEAFDTNNTYSYGLGIVKHSIGRVSWHKLDTMLLSARGEFEIDLPKGCYDLALLHPTSERLNYTINVTGTEKALELKAKLDQICIPEKIESVFIMGNFNNHRILADYKMVFNESDGTYHLPDSLKDAPITDFYFMVNMQKNFYSLKLPFNTYDAWASLSNQAPNGKETIVFDPKEYKQGTPSPIVEGKGADPTFNELSTSMRDMVALLKERVNAVKDPDGLKEFMAMHKTYYEKMVEMKATHGTNYPNLFWEPEYYFANDLNPIHIEYLHYALNENRDMADKIRRGPQQIAYTREKALATKNYIENSDWFPIGFYTSNIDNLDSEIQRMVLNKELGIPHGYFSQFLSNSIETQNDEVAGAILLVRARSISYLYPSRSLELLDQIRANHPTFSGIADGSLAKIEAGLKISEGTKAPDFTIKTLDGQHVTLSDLKGKFVFIDFWGTWCAPCREEIPYIVEMRKRIPADKLVVLGLSVGDKEETLRNFIAEQKIPYPNAMCDETTTQKYGVNSFPTTFLIDPSGNIVSKGLRGNQLTSYVLKLMQ